MRIFYQLILHYSWLFTILSTIWREFSWPHFSWPRRISLSKSPLWMHFLPWSFQSRCHAAFRSVFFYHSGQFGPICLFQFIYNQLSCEIWRSPPWRPHLLHFRQISYWWSWLKRHRLMPGVFQARFLPFSKTFAVSNNSYLPLESLGV